MPELHATMISFLLLGWPLPCLVVIEATPALATEPASGHHLAQERGSGEARLFEPLEEYIGNVQRSVEPNEVEQGERPHGIARPQHHAHVDVFLGRELLL